MAEIAREIGMTPRAFYRWFDRPTPPRGQRERLLKLERILGAPLGTDKGRGETVLNRLGETTSPYDRGRTRKIARPLSMPIVIIDIVGRIEHRLAYVLAELKDRGEQGPLRDRIAYISGAVEDLRKEVLPHIELDDEGDSV